MAASAKPVVRVRAGDTTGASARLASAGGYAGGFTARSNYAAADLGSQAMGGYLPPLLSADAAWLAERDVTVARLRDLIRNEGWAQSAVNRLTDMSVGATFRLSAKPDPVGLGISVEAAKAFGREIDAAWRQYADDPTFRGDVQRRLLFAGMVGLAFREMVGVGEAVAVLHWRPRAGWPFATCLQIIDPDRLSNPDGRMDDDHLRGGVELDDDGAPVAYYLRRRHPGDVAGSLDAFTWDRVPRWEQIGDWERPRVLHAYEMGRADQSRGISGLVSALVSTRMLSRYSEAEVRTAALNATITGAIYSEFGNHYMAELLGADESEMDWGALNTQRAEFYKNRPTYEDTRFLMMHPTDKLEMNTQARNTSGFPAFQAVFLQKLAASIGLSYEQLSMDWSKTNYSSARAALNEVWRRINVLRATIINSFTQPFYTAWLEDAIDSGRLTVPAGAPDFYDAPAAYVRADWIGPPRGYVDPVKEAQASQMRIEAMISTLEREIAEQGGDIDTVLPQLAAEQAMLASLGLRPSAVDPSVIAPTDDPNADRRPGEI
ncbi:phage portal protein [Methylobrevis pamukkalensis]|uniref:Phage portal protein, lambda family n=1 Tax=Methylobrevis pamukkalensis TaxID=1439726 RepID=A0A1E3H1L6_9HYPH|nr:phage portal protein [Methylobrevis pamukkalensis]ODN70210.1 Phage portal protein, lambda family [Methylobrevis pamukkalensis]